MPDSWDIFEDRAKSLLRRWRKAHDRMQLINPNLANPGKESIEGFLAEVNDDFTKTLKEKY